MPSPPPSAAVPFPDLDLNPDLEKTFSRPYSSQPLSPLFDLLPAELRPIILTELLYSPHPLQYTPSLDNYARSRGRTHKRDYYAHKPKNSEHHVEVAFFPWSDWRSIARPTFSFAPAILATCQALYHEGIPILYRHNTLAVSCAVDMELVLYWSFPSSWHVLAEAQLGPRTGCREDSETGAPPRLIDQLWKKADPSREPDPWSMHSRWDCTNVAIVLARMKRWEIRLTSSFREWFGGIAGACAKELHVGITLQDVENLVQSMGELLRGKEIVWIWEDELLTEENTQLVRSMVENGLGCRSLEMRFSHGQEGAV